MYARDDQVLVGKTLTGMKIASDKGALLFQTTEGDMFVRADGDCCSHTWIEHIELPALGFPAIVVAVDDLELPGSDNNHPEHDCLQVYGCKITTDRGEIVIDYRNSSNGYYGGSLVWPGEHFYGGVFGQNVSKHDWRDVSESKLKAADEAWHEQEDELQSLRSRLDSYEKTIRHVLFHWDHTLPADAYRRLLTITRDYGEADAPEPAVVERHQP